MAGHPEADSSTHAPRTDPEGDCRPGRLRSLAGVAARRRSTAGGETPSRGE
jgi:hypothetical protein